jgi:hypothetical protein
MGALQFSMGVETCQRTFCSGLFCRQALTDFSAELGANADQPDAVEGN